MASSTFVLIASLLLAPAIYAAKLDVVPRGRCFVSIAAIGRMRGN
jgi:hypothetical protein